MRLVLTVSDVFGGEATLTSETLAINYRTTGAIMISVVGDAVVPGVTVTVITTGVSDANGGGFVDISWYVDNQLRGDQSSYILDLQDLLAMRREGQASGASESLNNFSGVYVIGEYVDSLGFVTTMTARADITQNIGDYPEAVLSVSLDGYAFGQNRATAQVTGIPQNVIAAMHYQWETGTNGGFKLYKGAGQDTGEYLLLADDFNPQDSLRVLAEIKDVFGNAMTMTSHVLQINREATGQPVIREVNGGEITEGAVLFADLSDVNDANGELQVQSGVWMNANGDIIGRDRFYTLTEEDMRIGRIRYECVCVDPAGFENIVQTEQSFGSATPEQARVLLAAINAAADDGLWTMLNRHLDANYRGWHANGTAINSETDLASLLARGAMDEKRGIFDELSVRDSGVSDGREWTWWAFGNRSKINGTPSVDGQPLKYDGAYNVFYAGADIRIDHKLRAGVMTGTDSANLNVDWNDSGDMNGTLQQRMRMGVAYAELAPPTMLMTLRFYAGYGSGRANITEENGGAHGSKSRRRFAGAYGVYRMKHDDVELTWTGGGSHITGDLLDTPEIRGISGEHGEAKLNMEIARITDLESNGKWRNFADLRWRGQYGVLGNDRYYDAGLGTELSLPAHGWYAGANFLRQLNNGDHKRNSLGGHIAYQRGTLSSTWRANYAADEWRYRWEVGKTSDMSSGLLNGSFYAETDGSQVDGIGSEWRVDF